ncbi:MAG: hypothetical protein MMC33_004145 [Icmadophila ericetorum]|nr:hypothetical protein [Icmadophila ericetorum]
MPHAEETMSKQVNGEKGEYPQSKTISHIASYPVVAEGLKHFQSNPYGQKSIEVADHGYKSIVTPILPYAQGPYGYVKPYVTKADEMAEGGLKKVDETFPIVKEDTQKIKDSIFDLALLPFRIANHSKNYVLKTYEGEYKKCGGNGYVASGKAVVTTSLIATSDYLAWLSTFLAEKKEQVKETVKEKTNSK